MRKVGTKLLALLLFALSVSAQTINPNQIRPSTTNGYVLTTVGGATVWAPGTGAEFQHNGIDNASQTLLDLVQGTNMTITNTSDGHLRFDATTGSQLPPPFPVPAGQAVAWAYPRNCVGGPASSSNNGIALCGISSGYVAKYFSSPLGNCCWTDTW